MDLLVATADVEGGKSQNHLPERQPHRFPLVCYNELGDLYLDKRNKHHLARNLVHRLERLGYTAKLQQTAA